MKNSAYMLGAFVGPFIVLMIEFPIIAYINNKTFKKWGLTYKINFKHTCCMAFVFSIISLFATPQLVGRWVAALLFGSLAMFGFTYLLSFLGVITPNKAAENEATKPAPQSNNAAPIFIQAKTDDDNLRDARAAKISSAHSKTTLENISHEAKASLTPSAQKLIE